MAKYSNSFRFIRLILTLLGFMVGGVVGVAVSLKKPDVFAMVILIVIFGFFTSVLVWFFAAFTYWKYKLPYDTSWRHFRGGLESERMKRNKQRQ